MSPFIQLSADQLLRTQMEHKLPVELYFLWKMYDERCSKLVASIHAEYRCYMAAPFSWCQFPNLFLPFKEITVHTWHSSFIRFIYL
jgi:hypothetical protein